MELSQNFERFVQSPKLEKLPERQLRALKPGGGAKEGQGRVRGRGLGIRAGGARSDRTCPRRASCAVALSDVVCTCSPATSFLPAFFALSALGDCRRRSTTANKPRGGTRASADPGRNCCPAIWRTVDGCCLRTAAPQTSRARPRAGRERAQQPYILKN